MNEESFHPKSSRISSYYPLLIYIAYTILYQTYFSPLYLISILILINLHIESKYTVQIKSDGKFSIKKVVLKKYLYYFLCFVSSAILCFKFVLLSLDLISDSSLFIENLETKHRKNLEYYIDDSNLPEDFINTLMPSFLNLGISFLALFFELKLPKEIEWTHEIFYLTDNVVKKILLTKISLGLCLFFIPMLSVSIVGLVFLIIFLIFYSVQIFSLDEKKMLIIIKLLVFLVIVCNFIILISEFDYVHYDYIGLNGFKSGNLAFQVIIKTQLTFNIFFFLELYLHFCDDSHFYTNKLLS